MIFCWREHCARRGYERTWWRLISAHRRKCTVCGKEEEHRDNHRNATM